MTLSETWTTSDEYREEELYYQYIPKKSESDEEKLEKMDIRIIEKFLRNKKLEKINKL